MHRSVPDGMRLLCLAVFVAAAFVFRAAQPPFEVASAGMPVRIGPRQEAEPAPALPDGRAREEQLVRFFGGSLVPLVPGAEGTGDVITVMSFGDIMMSRNVHAMMEKNGEEYPYAAVKTALPLADLTVANLEGPVTERDNQPSNRMVFHFAPSRAALLARLGFDVLDLANNHAYDQGARGAEDTRRALSDKNLVTFGEAKSEVGANATTVEVRGTKIAFIGFQDVTRRIDGKAMVLAVAEARKTADIVLVSFHAGVEYVHTPNDRQRTLSEAAIDAGADAVISHHPHVVESIDVYKGRPIFYSLGNFVFDQYFSKATQEGLGVLLALENGSRRFYLLPIKSVRSQVRTLDAAERAAFLKALAGWSAPELGEAIRRGALEFPL
ncbi:CapA family protein [Candidatus Uhrbacteria bacterium]|nr:CapA family protein [Candidatus Uhrbacteria bacterium]